MSQPAREALLDKCVAHLLETGFGNLSLREIAAGAGTSHRMLIYHFGSRDGLLAAVVGRIEADSGPSSTRCCPVTARRSRSRGRFWRRVSDPSLAPAARLFFEIYVQALYGRDWTDSFRRAVIDAWEQPLIAAVGGADARLGPG